MLITAKLNYLKIAPRKVRLVAELIRGKDVLPALTVLSFTTKRAARPIKKLLQNALANAKQNHNLDESSLKIAKIQVNPGPRLKRIMPRARGQAYLIEKKMSHVVLTLQPKPGFEQAKAKLAVEAKQPELAKVQPSQAAAEEKGQARDVKPKFKPSKGPTVKLPIPGALKRVFRRKAF